MSVILEKYEHNQDFHQILDFIEASHIRIETTEEGTKILATVDGMLRTVSESSIRRNLKLNDETGIGSLPDAELFENLQLMGYNILPNQKFTFQKEQFSRQWKYLIHTIMQCLSPKGEGSGTLFEPYHTPSPEAQQTSPTTLSSPTLPPVTTVPIPTVTLSDTPHLRQYTIRARIDQSLALPPVADEPASPLRDISQGEACPTVSSVDAEHDRANIAKTSTLPHESTSRSDLVSKFEAQELEITMLKARVKLLEDREGGVAERSGDDAPIKGRSLDEGEKVAEKGIPTGSGSIPTAGPPAAGVPTGNDVVLTAGLIFATATVVTPYTRRKGKEKMIESETPKKKKIQEQMDIQMARSLEEEMEREAQRMNEQNAIDAEIARIHAEEELQIMIDGLDRSNETESVKKLKTSKEVKATEEVPEEKVKEMMQLVPIEEVYVEALQVKHPIVDWKVHTEGQRSYWMITRLGASYQFFMDMLKHLDREDLN
nr:hypothetical protein [Tanacetum cinerariifolium]